MTGLGVGVPVTYSLEGAKERCLELGLAACAGVTCESDVTSILYFS